MEAKSIKKTHDHQEVQLAQLHIWEYVLGFTPVAVVKCAIELRIPDVLESHGGAMTHSDLSAALGCSPSILRRIMRYLTHRGFFKQIQESPIRYAQTPLSRLLMRNGENSMVDLILLESSPVMLAPWHRLSSRSLTDDASAFGAEYGEGLWEYMSENPGHSKLLNGAMACRARLDALAIIEHCPEALKGIDSLVDVGGGDGTTLRTLIEACPWIQGINFDLPHVVCVAPRYDGIEHVDGDMFEAVPKANAALLMSVLHDWSDDECILILRKCREAIPKDKGKVIIAEAVIREGEDDKHAGLRLALDMVMLAHTETGKERTIDEWEYVVNGAGFTSYTVKHIDATISVIEAYP